MFHATKVLITLCTALLLISCVATGPREGASTTAVVVTDREDTTTEQTVEKTPDNSDAKAAKNEAIADAAGTVVGAVLVTAATIYAVTEFVEKKVVPVVLTLVVAGLVYEAARNPNPKSSD